MGGTALEENLHDTVNTWGGGGRRGSGGGGTAMEENLHDTVNTWGGGGRRGEWGGGAQQLRGNLYGKVNT